MSRKSSCFKPTCILPKPTYLLLKALNCEPTSILPKPTSILLKPTSILPETYVSHLA